MPGDQLVASSWQEQESSSSLFLIIDTHTDSWSTSTILCACYQHGDDVIIDNGRMHLMIANKNLELYLFSYPKKKEFHTSGPE